MSNQIGDIREALADTTWQAVLQQVDAHQHLRAPYFILVTTDALMNTHLTIMTLELVFTLIENMVDKRMTQAERSAVWAYLQDRKKMDAERRRFAKSIIDGIGMLATMLFRVDNKRGRIDAIWVLPRDVPLPDDLFEDSPVNEELAEHISKKRKDLYLHSN